MLLGVGAQGDLGSVTGGGGGQREICGVSLSLYD